MGRSQSDEGVLLQAAQPEVPNEHGIVMLK